MTAHSRCKPVKTCTHANDKNLLPSLTPAQPNASSTTIAPPPSRNHSPFYARSPAVMLCSQPPASFARARAATSKRTPFSSSKLHASKRCRSVVVRATSHEQQQQQQQTSKREILLSAAAAAACVAARWVGRWFGMKGEEGRAGSGKLDGWMERHRTCRPGPLFIGGSATANCIIHPRPCVSLIACTPQDCLVHPWLCLPCLAAAAGTAAIYIPVLLCASTQHAQPPCRTCGAWAEARCRRRGHTKGVL